MQTKFDIGDVVYVPMTVVKITMMWGLKEPEYQLKPLRKDSGEKDLFVSEKDILNKEDILNGKADESES